MRVAPRLAVSLLRVVPRGLRARGRLEARQRPAMLRGAVERTFPTQAAGVMVLRLADAAVEGSWQVALDAVVERGMLA